MFVKILVVGNYCHDSLLLPSGSFETLGGSSSYISAALSNIHDVSHSVVAKVGTDFLYRSRVKDAPIIVSDQPTTHFVDDLREELRKERLKARCSPINASDVTGRKAEIALACGVAMEILPETVKEMKANCRLVVADAQALLRDADNEGRVFLKEFARTEFSHLLSCFDFIKASEHEAKFINVAEIRKKVCLLITKGPAGSTVIYKDKEVEIPSKPIDEVDATGAGDCFIAGFALGLAQGRSIEEAALQGNRFGALAVQQVGVPNFANL